MGALLDSTPRLEAESETKVSTGEGKPEVIEKQVVLVVPIEVDRRDRRRTLRVTGPATQLGAEASVRSNVVEGIEAVISIEEHLVAAITIEVDALISDMSLV